MTDSQQLLAEHVQTGSETAFRELVTRYVDLVYSAAIRLVNGELFQVPLWPVRQLAVERP